MFSEGVKNLFVGLKNEKPDLVIGLGLTKDQQVLNLGILMYYLVIITSMVKISKDPY